MPLITNRHLQTKEYAEKFICELFKIPRTVIHSKSRTSECSRARWSVWYVLRYGYCMSFAEIAKLYGKNKSTVIHGYNAFIQKKFDRDIEIEPGEKFSP